MSLSLLVAIAASASVYAMLATAVVLIYRSSHVLPFHVGEIGVLAAYVTVTVLAVSRPGVAGTLLAVAAGIVSALAVAVATHVVVDRWARSRGPFVGTVLTIAAGILLLGLVSLIWSGESRRLNLAPGRIAIGAISVPLNSIVVIVGGTLAVLTVQLLVARTRLGIEMRAVANSPRLAALRGIDVPRVLLVAWLLAGALASMGGIGVASLSSVAMEGAFVGVSAVVAAVLGGMTSLPGALLGAVLIAIVENSVTVLFDARYSQIVPILALLIVLAIRPSGLTGRVEHIARV